MNLPYLARLACLCLAAFFLLHLVLGLLISALTPMVVRLGQRMAPAAGARVLLILRLLPSGLALFLVAGLFTPSYLWLEPKTASEPMGLACPMAAVLTLALWGLSIARSSRALVRSRRHMQRCRQTSRDLRLPGERVAAWVIEGKAPCVMLTGLVRQRVVLSRNVVAALSAEQLSAVIRHERAHGASRDNLKRLLVLLAPDLLPFVRAFGRLERDWARIVEWAADDRAAAGKPRRSISLASALVRVARLGTAPSAPALVTSLMADSTDLSIRVDRLLRPSRVLAPRVPPEPILLAASSLLLSGAVMAVLAHPATLHSAHEFLEFLI